MTPSTDTPMRDGPGGRVMCGGDLPSRRASYCTRACQQLIYRLRHRIPTADVTSVRKTLQRRKALVAHTIYECPSCSERFIGERRCDACGLFCRALGLGGLCTECDTPVLLDDLLGEGVIATA